MISILWYLTHIGAKTDAPKDIDCTSTWFTFHNVAYAFSCITNKFFSLVSSTNFFLLYHQQIFFSCIINNFFSLVSSTIFFSFFQIGASASQHTKEVIPVFAEGTGMMWPNQHASAAFPSALTPRGLKFTNKMIHGTKSSPPTKVKDFLFALDIFSR